MSWRLPLVCLVVGLIGGFAIGRHQRPVPETQFGQRADDIAAVVGWGRGQLAEAAAVRQRAAAAQDFARSHRAAASPTVTLPEAPPRGATASDSMRWARRTIDAYITITGNLQHDTLRLGQVADSAMAAADLYREADSLSRRAADSLMVVLDSAAIDLRAAADTVGRLKARVKSLERRAYGTHLGAGVNLAAVQQTFTSVAGLSVQTTKKLLFLEVDARAIGGWGIGGDGTEVRAGPGAAAQVTVTF